jgi:hypothetical protein
VKRDHENFVHLRPHSEITRQLYKLARVLLSYHSPIQRIALPMSSLSTAVLNNRRDWNAVRRKTLLASASVFVTLSHLLVTVIGNGVLTHDIVGR